MAAPHAFVTYSIQDAKGKVSVTKINFPASTTLAELSSWAIAMATALNDVIQGKILSAGAGFEIDLSTATIRATPLSTSDVEEGARFIWRSLVGAITQFRLPTFDEAKMLSGTQQVDLADADVSVVTGLVTIGTGAGAGFAHPSDDHGSDITALESARESFTSTRN
jgi:hypothetical protein